MRLSILLFDGITALDAIGGYEVLARIPGMETEFFSETAGAISADTRQLGLVATKSFSEVEQTDILYVPGGPGVAAVVANQTYLNKIRQLNETSSWTIGICNGVGILAAAGLLEGQQATTNFFFRDRLREAGVDVVNDRYCRSGKFITGAGVSASIDTALFLTQLLTSEQLAKTLQLGIEYYPAPPFPERLPEEAPEASKQIVRAFEAMAVSNLQSSAV